jgi:hypothetical protein
MSEFWSLSTGEDITKTGSSFESGGGSMEPIPENTTAVAIIDEAKWEQDLNGNEYVSLRWSILAPQEYKNRKIFQKSWVDDLKPDQKDPEKYRDKQRKMFFAIDTNCGGKLARSGKRPTDEMLGMLTNKPMMIKIMTWDDRETKKPRGNWIAAVAPRVGAEAAKATHVAEDDDAPF